MKIQTPTHTFNINFKVVLITIAVITLIFNILGSFYTVQAGERALVFRFGDVVSTESEGLHFKLPFVDKVLKVDIRTKKTSADGEASTKDIQSVTTEVSLNYHFDVAKLKEIYSKTGIDVDDKIVHPRIQEIVKAVSAKFSAEQLITSRELVKSEIAIALRTDLAKYYLVVEDIQITNFRFSKEFANSIEAKQTSAQLALKAKNDLDRIKVEAEQIVATAEAEAKAITIKTQAINSAGGKNYTSLKFIEKWDGVMPRVTSSKDMLLMLDEK